MSEQYLTHLTMPTYPLHQLTTLLLEEEAKEVLLKHGCTIEEHDYSEECLIFFPEGTTKTEILLRLMLPRYRIKLPPLEIALATSCRRCGVWYLWRCSTHR